MAGSSAGAGGRYLVACGWWLIAPGAAGACVACAARAACAASAACAVCAAFFFFFLGLEPGTSPFSSFLAKDPAFGFYEH